jgi:hypothetical protein
MQVISLTLRPLYPQGKSPRYPANGDWVGPTTGLDVLKKKSLARAREPNTISEFLSQFPCHCTYWAIPVQMLICINSLINYIRQSPWATISLWVKSKYSLYTEPEIALPFSHETGTTLCSRRQELPVHTPTWCWFRIHLTSQSQQDLISHSLILHGLLLSVSCPHLADMYSTCVKVVTPELTCTCDIVVLWMS